MEKDIGRITKNPETEILVRIDDFGGRVGLTIREFVKSERYSGFTKAGTRIPASQFKAFKDLINSIDEEELQAASEAASESSQSSPGESPSGSSQSKLSKDKKPAKKSDMEEMEF